MQTGKAACAIGHSDLSLSFSHIQTLNPEEILNSDQYVWLYRLIEYSLYMHKLTLLPFGVLAVLSAIGLRSLFK